MDRREEAPSLEPEPHTTSPHGAGRTPLGHLMHFRRLDA